MANADEPEEKPLDLIDTVKMPDLSKDPAEAIEEDGEPFEGNNA